LIQRGTNVDGYIKNNIDVFEPHLMYQRDSDDEYYFVGEIIDSARICEPEMIDIQEFENISITKKESFDFYKLIKGQIDYEPTFYLLCVE
jgi:hypothetical protein